MHPLITLLLEEWRREVARSEQFRANVLRELLHELATSEQTPAALTKLREAWIERGRTCGSHRMEVENRCAQELGGAISHLPFAWLPASTEAAADTITLSSLTVELAECLRRLVVKYGYHDDGETPKDWTEYVDARQVLNRFDSLGSDGWTPVAATPDQGRGYLVYDDEAGQTTAAYDNGTWYGDFYAEESSRRPILQAVRCYRQLPPDPKASA